jgi:hypothetical protein
VTSLFNSNSRSLPRSTSSQETRETARQPVSRRTSYLRLASAYLRVARSSLVTRLSLSLSLSLAPSVILWPTTTFYCSRNSPAYREGYRSITPNANIGASNLVVLTLSHTRLSLPKNSTLITLESSFYSNSTLYYSTHGVITPRHHFRLSADYQQLNDSATTAYLHVVEFQQNYASRRQSTHTIHDAERPT